MICPICLDEYQLLDLDVDPETLEHRGIFKCQCGESVLFPESLTRDAVSDEDLEERIRLSRLLHLSRKLHEKEIEKPSSNMAIISLKTRQLRLYLEHISEQSLPKLK